MPDDLSVTRVSGPDSPAAADPGATVADPGATVARAVDPHPAVLRAGSDGLPVIPGYEVTRELARGGMGRVLAARDLTLDRPVAIKALLPCAGADGARRFVTEAGVTARLQHPNIPPVYALGALADGAPFLAMKLVEGRTLSARLRDRASPADDMQTITRTFEQICLAVGFAHSKGIVHRDLKPANVMIGAFGEVQVMDWGLAKFGDGGPGLADRKPGAGAPASAEPAAATQEGALDTDATLAGQVLGTPAYMPPEQARGEPVDARADVFSLGAILCEILTGSRPFTGATPADVIGRTVSGDLGAALAKLDASGADAELVALAKRCLAPAAADRPANGKAVADAIAAYRAGADARLRAAEAERAAAEARAAEQRKRRRAQLALAGAVAALLLGAGAFGWYSDRQAAELDRQAAARKFDAERNASEKAIAELQQREKDARAADDNRRATTELLQRCEVALGAADAGAARIVLDELARRETQPGAEALRERVAGCRADLALLARLNRIDDVLWSPVREDAAGRGELTAPASAVPLWAQAFAGYGIVPGTAPVAEAVGRVNRSHIRERLLGAMDQWHLFGAAPGLAELLGAADPDAVRDGFRAAVARRDWLRAASVLQSHTAGPDAGALPARFAVAASATPRMPLPQRRALLERAAVQNPGDSAVLMGLGFSSPPGRPDGERVRWFQAAAAARPRSPAPHMFLGLALAALGRFDDALRSLREVVRLEPANVWGHLHLAQTLRRTDPVAAGAALREAVRVAREATRANPDDSGALFALGNVLWDAGDLAGAEASFRGVLGRDPGFSPARNNLAILLKQRGDLPGAIAEYREVVRRDPEHPATYYNLGIALRASRDTDGAIAAYRELLVLAPDHANGRNNLGSALQLKGDLDGAVAEYREVLRRAPDHEYARINLADALRDRGDLDEAVAEYGKVPEQHRPFKRAQEHLASARRDRDDPDGAIARYRAALQRNPDDNDARADLESVRRYKAKRDRLAPPPREAPRP